MKNLINRLPAIFYANIDRFPGKYGKGLSSQVVKIYTGGSSYNNQLTYLECSDHTPASL